MSVLCDVVYVMQVERLERHMTAVSAALAAAGADGALGLPDEARAAFDADLNAEPRDSPTTKLRRELGVA